MRAILVGLAVVVALLVSAPANASNGCTAAVGLDSANATCHWAYAEYQQSSSAGDDHTWVVNLQCANGGICTDHVECVEGGEEGFWHDVFMDGVDVGDVCVPESEAPEGSIVDFVLDEFKKIAWPRSGLIIQPPKGRTLVNLETILYTKNDAPRTLELLIGGRNVTIEATPVSYIWIHGDGTRSETRSPGHPYPRHDVFHVYESAEQVDVRVDTVYGNGRYRIGSGEWRAIPGSPTVTVVGPTEQLEIVEAKPQLVIR